MQSILAVDDSPSMRKMVSFTLTGAGYHVVEAVDGQDALEKAETHDIQLVLADQNMPRLDGIGLTRKLREMKVARAIESRYSKDRILELYLNQIAFGSGAFGVETASQRYFGKSVRELTIAEAVELVQAAVIALPFLDEAHDGGNHGSSSFSWGRPVRGRRNRCTS